MKPRYGAIFFPLLLLSMAGAGASDQKSAPPPHMTSQTRMELVRGFESELVYIRAQFPMGNKGLNLKDGVLSPSGVELQRLLVTWGPSVKPGDQARISGIVIGRNSIHFEINGGPVKKQKWYQHIQIGGAGGTTPIAPSDANANPRGSYVDLVFDHYVPEMNAVQLKHLLRPVFDFDSKSALDAYLETVPPKVKEAIKNHQVLVGMNREMVIYSKGRAAQKIREKEGETEYEDWVYGTPPQDVDFVRFVGDEVTRVETMKVTGEKIVRLEKEVDLSPQPNVAAATSQPDQQPPSLRRPGEDLPRGSTTVTDRPLPRVPRAPPPTDPNAQPPSTHPDAQPPFLPSEMAQADSPR
ncbi:MAG: hypothetical protein ACRD3L_04625 [Terriglobales bacterium]